MANIAEIVSTLQQERSRTAQEVTRLDQAIAALRSLDGGSNRTATRGIGVRPEEVEIDMGTRRFRYLRIFTIRPDAPLAGTALDFSGETIGPDLLHGYRDACAQIENFLAYAQQAKFRRPRRVLRFSPEHDPSRTA